MVLPVVGVVGVDGVDEFEKELARAQKATAVEASDVEGPSCAECLLPLVLTAIGVGLRLGFEPAGMLVPEAAAAYPIWFGEGTSRVYCDAAAIIMCASDESSTACCGYLEDGAHPGAQVSNLWLMVAIIAFPLLLFAGVCSCVCIFPLKMNFNKFEFKATMLGWWLAFVASWALTELFKRNIGAPRPNYEALTAALRYDKLSNRSTYSDFEHERYMNMPSGHASMSMASFMYVSLYLLSKVQALLPVPNVRSVAPKGDDSNSNTLRTIPRALRQWCMFLSCVPVVFAVWVGSTRIDDYWHTPAAVVFGMLVGACSAAFGWFVSAWPYLEQIWSAAVAARHSA